MTAIAIELPGILPDQRPALGETVKDFLSGLVFVVTHPTGVRNTLADTVVDLIDVSGPGALEIQAAGGAEVATLAFGNPAFGAATGGTATANPISNDTNATGGTAAQFEANDGADAQVFLGSVGTSGEDINLSSVTIGAGDTVSISSLTYTAPA